MRFLLRDRTAFLFSPSVFNHFIIHYVVHLPSCGFLFDLSTFTLHFSETSWLFYIPCSLNVGWVHESSFTSQCVFLVWVILKSVFSVKWSWELVAALKDIQCQEQYGQFSLEFPQLFWQWEGKVLSPHSNFCLILSRLLSFGGCQFSFSKCSSKRSEMVEIEKDVQRMQSSSNTFNWKESLGLRNSCNDLLACNTLRLISSLSCTLTLLMSVGLLLKCAFKKWLCIRLGKSNCVWQYEKEVVVCDCMMWSRDAHCISWW